MGIRVSFGTGVTFGGINLGSLADGDLEVTQASNGLVTITGHY